MMTTATKKNTRRALNVFLLLVGAVGFFMALGKALSTLIADEDKSKNSNATEMLDRFFGDSKDHGESQYQLGMMYRHGEGCETNNEDAVKCFRKAAAQGHVFAQLELGTMYFWGDGVVTNNHEAVKWLSLSAEQGNCPAKMFLNIMYIQGMYAEADLEEVSKWYHHMENDQCDSLTPYLLGIVYLNGGFVGVETNRQEATKWLYRAAANGCIEAKYELGLMCHEGDGTVTNSQEATEWYRKATEKRYQHMSTREAYAMVFSRVFGLDRKDTTPKTEMKQTVKGDHAESQCAPSKLSSKDEFVKMKAKSVKWIHHAAENGTAEPQSDKTFPRVVTLDQTNIFRDARQDKPLRALALGQTNIIHDIKQDKTLRAIGPLFAGAMRGKTPRARAGKGLLGIGVLALSTWLHHKADENRKEAEEIRRRRANEDKTPTIAPAIKGFGLHQGGTGSGLSVICGRDGARPSQ